MNEAIVPIVIQNLSIASIASWSGIGEISSSYTNAKGNTAMKDKKFESQLQGRWYFIDLISQFVGLNTRQKIELAFRFTMRMPTSNNKESDVRRCMSQCLAELGVEYDKEEFAFTFEEYSDTVADTPVFDIDKWGSNE